MLSIQANQKGNMSRKPSVGVVIVNWNGLEHLKLSLQSMANQHYSLLTVYIVDNGSTDGSIDYIKKEFPDMVLLETNKNLGFAGGNNVGMERALADGHEYLVLINNDTNSKPSVVSQLVNYMEQHPRVGIAQPKLLLLDHPDTIDACGSWLTKTGFLRHFGCEEKDGPQYSKVTPVFTVKGAAMIVRRKVLEDIGLFDDDFFAYFEETDLCWRAWLRGWKVYYAPVAEVYHKIGGSTKKIGSPTINYHSFKNRIMSMIKNLAWYNVLWMVPLHVLLIIGFSFIYFAAFRWRNGFGVYRCIWWNIVHLPANLKKRRMIQKTRVVSDPTLFKSIMKPINYLESFDFATRFFADKRKVDLGRKEG